VQDEHFLVNYVDAMHCHEKQRQRGPTFKSWLTTSRVHSSLSFDSSWVAGAPKQTKKISCHSPTPPPQANASRERANCHDLGVEKGVPAFSHLSDASTRLPVQPSKGFIHQ
jgi:hypothetical protein